MAKIYIKKLDVKVSEETEQAIVKEAADTGRGKSSLVRFIIESYFKKLNK